MGARINWVERKFSFDYSADNYPEILARLRGTPARAEDLARGLSARQLRERRDGRWSIQEQIGHLVEVDTLQDGRLDDFAAGLEVLRAADMSNARTRAAEYNDRPLSEILAALRRVRGAILARLEDLPPEAFALSATHPRLAQEMRLVDSCYFFAEHDDYHLARMAELLR